MDYPTELCLKMLAYVATADHTASLVSSEAKERLEAFFPPETITEAMDQLLQRKARAGGAITLEVYPTIGYSIDDAILEMIDLAEKTGTPVRMKGNGEEYFARPGCTPAQVKDHPIRIE